MSSGGEGEIVINVSTPDGVPVGALSGIGLTNGPEFDRYIAEIRQRSYERHVAARHITVYRDGAS